MTHNLKKRSILRDETQDKPENFSVTTISHEHSRILKVAPIGMRVLVKLRPDSNLSDGGLYLPEGAKSSQAESMLAEVIEVASAMDDHTQEEANISGIPLHALVLLPKGAGVEVPWDKELRIVETKEVLAIVNEVEIV